MGISQYLKEIGRGKQGARPLARAQAADLFGQLLDGSVTDLEVGAFCLAMRIKGETPEEMAGFLDATHERLQRVRSASGKPVVVLPSYNGARRLPVLTPLLAALVARRGLPVLIHGTATESSRVCVRDVLQAMDVQPADTPPALRDGQLAYVPTEVLSPGLKRLLDVRRVVGLRNSAHSLVKLMNPCDGPAVIVSSYTHPEYALSMGEVFERVGATALLLRGTEGEAVADARRLPKMEGFVRGERVLLEEGRKGTLTDLPELPKEVDVETTAAYIRAVLAGQKQVPDSMALQVEHILRLASRMNTGKVTLVGAGPGDPELLTLKALKAIQAATVLLVDDLVSPEVVAHAPATARVVHVGKRGGCKSTPQAFIERLMLIAAREGENVVRLKGGDPFIFGRGGEEVEHLRAAGVRVEVINGITSGLAAATSLGVPLTHRDHAQGVLFLTGHAQKGGSAPDWRAIGAMARDARLTLVIYMGVRSAERIQQDLLSGLPPDTPVAVVQQASLPGQRQVTTTLGALAATIAREQFASPAVIVVGDVVRGVAAASDAPARFGTG